MWTFNNGLIPNNAYTMNKWKNILRIDNITDRNYGTYECLGTIDYPPSYPFFVAQGHIGK